MMKGPNAVEQCAVDVDIVGIDVDIHQDIVDVADLDIDEDVDLDVEGEAVDAVAMDSAVVSDVDIDVDVEVDVEAEQCVVRNYLPPNSMGAADSVESDTAASPDDVGGVANILAVVGSIVDTAALGTLVVLVVAAAVAGYHASVVDAAC